MEEFEFGYELEEKLSSFLENRNTALDQDQEDALCEILNRFFRSHNKHQIAQLLPADTGWGKTRVAIYAAYIMKHCLNMDTLVICPANIKGQWKNAMKEFELSPLGIYSYEKVRGSRSKAECNHPYLERKNGEFGPFKITHEWEELLKEGVFLIIDESQKLKNDSGQHFACVELIHSLCNRRPLHSRLLHLTASFIDKPCNWKNLLRCFGYTKQEKMFTLRKNASIFISGIEEIRAVAESIDKVQTTSIFLQHNLSEKNVSGILQQLWVKIFRNLVVIPVTDPVYLHPVTKEPFKRLRYNAFYELDEEGQEQAAWAISSLKKANILREDGYVDMYAANNNFGLIQKSIMQLCEAKMPTVVRLAIEDLESHPTRKVILAIPFISSQETVYEQLKKYNPLILNGNISIDDRPDVIDKFNAPNLEYRVLIMTPEVGGVGVSLHDSHGNFPRRLRMISTYNFGSCFQSTGRTYRRGLMSDVEVYIIYAANAPLESILLNTLVKSRICNDVILPGTNRVFPGEYDIYIENEDKYKELRNTLEKMKKINSFLLNY